jgi:hypothetical protein
LEVGEAIIIDVTDGDESSPYDNLRRVVQQEQSGGSSMLYPIGTKPMLSSKGIDPIADLLVGTQHGRKPSRIGYPSPPLLGGVAGKGWRDRMESG